MFVGRGTTMQDLMSLASGLTMGPNGIWYARHSSPIDYPAEANAFCFAIEDASFWYRHRNAVIVDVVRRFPPSGFIADVGAGNGFVSLGLQRSGFETLLIEPGETGIHNARRRGLEPLVCATLQDAKFAPGSFPAAGLFDVLEHIGDDVGVLRLLHTLIAPGGRLYLAVPTFQLLWSVDDASTGHHRRYTVGGLNERLRAAGFSPEFATYFFWPLPLPILLFRALPWKLGVQKTLDPDRLAAELRPPNRVAVCAVEAMLGLERALISRGWRVPVGSSCLIVACRAPRKHGAEFLALMP